MLDIQIVTLGIRGSETFFNLLAPAVTQDHLHLGATFSLKNGKEISLAYVHAFDNTLDGVNSIAPSFGGGNANLRMYQNSAQVSFGWNKDKYHLMAQRGKE